MPGKGKSIAAKLETFKGAQLIMDKFLKDLPCYYCRSYRNMKSQTRYYCAITGLEGEGDFLSPVLSASIPCSNSESFNCKLLSAINKVREQDEVLSGR